MVVSASGWPIPDPEALLRPPEFSGTCAKTSAPASPPTQQREREGKVQKALGAKIAGRAGADLAVM
eukprot:scaffold1307_cov200-Pinguiococcus_pyrenoidosus.AAC.7